MSEVAALEVVKPEDKRPQVEALLGDVFKLMDYPAKLDFKDMPDGSLGVAVHFDGELPGVVAGKRSHLVDCVQFWLNKVVNRPSVPRRWVNLGVDAFPEARMPGQPREPRMPGQPREPREPQDQAPAPSAPAQGEKRAEQPKRNDQRRADQKKPDQKPAEPRASAPPQQQQQQQQRRGRETDERSLTPAADPALTAVGKLLAEKAAKHGRLYAVMLLTPDARALMLKAADGVQGVTAKVEGEGHWRRLVLVPEKLTVITKKQVMPDYDDEDEDE